MNDLQRLKWLLIHYAKPHARTFKSLEKYREKCGGKIPDSRPRPPVNEWEGPFFCRVIVELLNFRQKEIISSIKSRKFKVTEGRAGDRR